MRWLKKREFLAYYLLFRTFNRKKVNIGELISILGLFFSRKTTFNIIKRLRKLGLLKQINELEYEITDLQVFLDTISAHYFLQRLKRTLKSRGLRVGVEIDEEEVTIEGAPGKILEELSKIPFIKLKQKLSQG